MEDPGILGVGFHRAGESAGVARFGNGKKSRFGGGVPGRAGGRGAVGWRLRASGGVQRARVRAGARVAPFRAAAGIAAG